MNKLPLIVIAILIINISLISAIDLTIEKKSISSTLISESDKLATFEFKITNNGETDDFEIYSLVSVVMYPKERFEIKKGETKTLEVMADPARKIRDSKNGNFAFEYQIKGKNSGIQKETLTIKIIPLKDVIKIIPSDLHPGQQAIIEIKNLEDLSLDNLDLNFDSKLFQGHSKISLGPHESINLTFEPKEIKELEAGKYPIKTEINLDSINSEKDSEINYLEENGISTTEESKGLIIRETKIEKKNLGNIPTLVRINEEKDIFSRLFTTYSEKPSSAERKGFFVEYKWERALKPNESIILITTTNYTFPFILLLLLIIITISVKIYFQTDLILKKRISFVKTKGGEFALKVRLKARAKKHLDDIKIIDRIPRMTKIHEKFGTRPDKIDDKTRQIYWNIKSLRKGEERIFSYIIYSKINIIGKFQLPAARASYKKEDETKVQQVLSNRTSFAAESS